MKTVKVTIVSPTYNEAENVTRLVHQVGGALSGVDYELLIADDDSPDRTWAVAQELAARNPRIRVIRRTTDRGLSPAVIEGFLSALVERFEAGAVRELLAEALERRLAQVLAG